MVQEETKVVQPYPMESPDLWLKLRKALAKGDTDGAAATLKKMELSERLVKLFSVAISEESELAATIEAAAGQREKLNAAIARRDAVAKIAPQTIEAVNEQTTVLEQTRWQILGAGQLLTAASIAARQRGLIRGWLRVLWAETEIDPRHAGALLSLSLPPRLAQVVGELGLDPFRLRSWAALDKPAAGPPRRNFQSWIPVKPAGRQ
jgi:hypothetical protein